MAEFVYNPEQTVQPNQNVLLNGSIPCPKGNVIHRDGSGILTLRGSVNNPNACFARYQVIFSGNIAVSEGGTAGPIAVALAISGEPIQTSKAIVTPTAAEAYFNVTSPAIIDVPRGCCLNVAVENVSDGGVPINVQNANLTVSRIA